jgi:hypothetical protein
MSQIHAIFSDTVLIDPKLIAPIRGVVDQVLSEINITSISVGSTYSPNLDNWSCDIDLQVDIDKIGNVFNKPSAAENRKALATHFTLKGLDTARIGINVFVRVPFNNKAYQVDLECIRNVDKISRYHQHAIPKGSPYKGVNKQLMILHLAKQQGFMYSAWEGLYARTIDNKKGVLVTDDWDDIALLLIGVRDGNKLGSVESIMNALPTNEAHNLLAIATQDKNWYTHG